MAKTILGKLIIDRSISRPFAHRQDSTGTSKLNSLSPDVYSSCYDVVGLLRWFEFRHRLLPNSETCWMEGT